MYLAHCLMTFMSVMMPLMLLAISLVFSPLIAKPENVDAFSKCLTESTSFHSCPANQSIYHGQDTLATVLPPLLTEQLF